MFFVWCVGVLIWCCCMVYSCVVVARCFFVWCFNMAFVCCVVYGVLVFSYVVFALCFSMLFFVGVCVW